MMREEDEKEGNLKRGGGRRGKTQKKTEEKKGKAQRMGNEKERKEDAESSKKRPTEGVPGGRKELHKGLKLLKKTTGNESEERKKNEEKTS